MWDKEMEYVKQLVGNQGSIVSALSKKKKKKKDEDKMYNILEEDRDFENCNGWSSTVTSNNLDALEGSDIGVFMVNLTKGSMMGPHWNPIATEIAIVLEGQGMVRVVCPKTDANVAECKNMRFHVKEGDAFVVPRFHPMAQMAFNNGSFVFMGFSTSAKNNNPQFLAGKASVFRTLNVDVVAASFNVPNTTITRLLASQDDSVILECVSCAEEDLRIMKKEIEREKEEREKREERKKEEEARHGGEEEARERKEEKARREEKGRKQIEEEEARRKEREEGRRRREEERRSEEEGGAQSRKEREAQRRREGETAQEAQERARRAEEQAKRAAEEMDRRASEETRRAAEEEQERERRQWQPHEGGGGRGEPRRRQWEHQGGRGEREEGGRGKWDEERRRSLKHLTI